MTQTRCHPPAQAMMTRRKESGDSGREAMRVLKRRLSDVIYAALRAAPAEKQSVQNNRAGRVLRRARVSRYGAALGQQIGDVPAFVADRVIKQSPARPVGCFGVGSAVEQGTSDIDVVAAGRPVQQRFAEAVLTAASVRVCAVVDQQSDDLGTAG